MTQTRWLSILVASTLAVAPAPALTAAQEETPEQATAVAEPESESPQGAIPQTSIVSRSRETESLVARAIELAAPDGETETIKDALEIEALTLDRKRAELDQLESGVVTDRTLMDQRERWQRSEQRIVDWQADLQARLQLLIELRDRIEDDRAAWLATRDDLVGSGLGSGVVGTVTDLIAEVDGASDQLAARIEQLTELVNRADRRLDEATSALAEIEEARETVRGRVWTRTAPPLWSTPIMGIGVVGEEMVTAADYWWTTATDWLGAHYARVAFLGVLFVTLLVATLAMRRFREHWREDPHLEGAVFVVSRPLATAGIATLGAAVFVLDPTTGPVNDLIRLIGILVVIRLASGLSAPLPRHTYRGLAALFAVQILVGFVPDGSLLSRLLSLVLAIGAVLVGRASLVTWPTDAGTIWRLGRYGVGGAIVISAIGGVANILGWVDLGTMLVGAAIASSLGAFAWMLLLHAAEALLALLHVGMSDFTLTSRHDRQREFDRVLMLPLRILAVIGWSRGLFENLRLTDQATAVGGTVLGASLDVGNLTLSVGGVTAAVVIIVITTFIARIVRFVLAQEIFPRMAMRAGTRSTVVSLINYIILGIGIVMAATAAGFSATQLTVLIGAMSVGIGFGLQAVVSNFVSGLILMFERPISVGDQVEAGGYLGIITHIGIRASRIQTFDGSDVIIPNSELVTRQVRNWTLTNETKRINLDVEVGLDSEPALVMEAMAAVATEHELVLDDPAPRSLMLGYGDSSISFRLQFWLLVANAVAVPSQIHLALIERLRADGVEIPPVRRERHQE